MDTARSIRGVTGWAWAWALVTHAGSAHAQDLAKGPWLMDLHPTSVVVMVERRWRGPVTVRLTAEGPAASVALHGRVASTVPPAPMEVRDDASEVMHEVRVTGLSPGVRYRYEVTGPGITPTGGEFSTAPVLDVPFRFVVYGDTRSGGSDHRAVVRAIVRDAPDFVLHTGDMVGNGAEERMWQQFFEIERPLLINAPLVPVVGNHEIIRPFSDGIENYRRLMHVDATGPRPELDYTYRYGGARFVIANAYDDWTGDARAWLEEELARARRESPDGWLFVAMHWGPRSAGPHGDNGLLHDAGVDELLRRARVDLVIAGHDHDYERGDDEGLRYMVSGGGGAPLYHQMRSKRATRLFAGEHHYVTLDVERTRVLLTARRVDGTLLDRATLTHDGWRDERREAGPSRPMEETIEAPTVRPDATGGRAGALPMVRRSPWPTLAPLGLFVLGVAALARWRRAPGAQ